MQALTLGAQDLLSFNYQLGLLANLASGSSLPVATGKKYGQYRLEVVGDEEVEVPAGTFRCLHPVSYTHLDVYKRQGLYRPGFR